MSTLTAKGLAVSWVKSLIFGNEVAQLDLGVIIFGVSTFVESLEGLW